MAATKKTSKLSETTTPSNRSATTRPDEMPAEVLEFITAIDDYKRANRRPFPTWSEVLEILKELGYTRSKG
jgi:hypothetical protein